MSFLRNPSSRQALRAALVLLGVALLHLLAVAWSTRQFGRAQIVLPPTVITVSLETLPQNPPPLKPPPKETPKPRPKPRSKPPKPSLRPPLPAPTPPSIPPEAASETPPLMAGPQGDWQTAGGNGNGNGNGNENSGDNASASAASLSDDSPAPVQPSAHGVDAPPSVILKYDVQGLRDGQKVYGSGKIVWRNQDGRYRIDGSASVLFFTLLQFGSDGLLDDYGVSPILYTEKRFRKPSTDTRFEHERNTITFSASDNSYPRPGDAQDRASIIWQLATTGRGNPAAFFTGASFTMFVAGVRDAEPWQIIVSGQDEIEAGSETVSAWHLVRMPQPGSYDQKIDIWLAPRQQWYPLKIRYTENNGDYLEMSLSSLTPT